MVWSSPKPKLGDRKIVTKFALIPHRIGESKVWLQRYYFVAEYSHDLTWHPLRWISTHERADTITREESERYLVVPPPAPPAPKTPEQRRESLTVIKGEKE